MRFNKENSIAAVNEYRNDHGILSQATVMIKRYGSNSICKKNCEIFVGVGQYGHHNMPHVSINYETDYDCMYVEMEYDDDMLTIYDNNTIIEIIPHSTKNEEDE